MKEKGIDQAERCEHGFDVDSEYCPTCCTVTPEQERRLRELQRRPDEPQFRLVD